MKWREIFLTPVLAAKKPISIVPVIAFYVHCIIIIFNEKLSRLHIFLSTSNCSSCQVGNKPQNAMVPSPFSTALAWLDGPVRVSVLDSSPLTVMKDCVFFVVVSRSLVPCSNARFDFELRRCACFFDSCEVVTFVLVP